MKIISADQFTTADQELKEEIMKWWEPQMMDLYVPLDGNPEVISRQKQLEAVKKFKDKGNVPLLTVEQLIDFVETKTGTKICIDYDCDDIYLELRKMCDGCAYTIYTSVCCELIEGLWELAKQVIKDKLS